MKRCPSCNRTYSDESISFCLADGTLLSAPYDTVKEEPPPTEILPSPYAAVPPTKPANSAIPTMTSLPGAHVYSLPEVQTPKPTRSRALMWAGVAVAILALVGLGILASRNVFTKKSDTLASDTPEELVVQNSGNANVSPDNSNYNSTLTIANRTTTTPTVAKTPAQANQTSTPAADPVLFPPESKSTPAAIPSPATDYDRIFRAGEVDSRARVLSKPEPGYTEAARKNQISGVVILRAVFSSSGSVTNVSVIRGLPDGLSEKAIAAARQITFIPARKHGRPVSMWMQLEYNFNLY